MTARVRLRRTEVSRRGPRAGAGRRTRGLPLAAWALALLAAWALALLLAPPLSTHAWAVNGFLSAPPALRFLPMMGSGCSEERLKATQAFHADPSRAAPGVEQTLERVADMVHGCISLREREGKAVSGYLRSLGAK